jgi:hypothetical protein
MRRVWLVLLRVGCDQAITTPWPAAEHSPAARVAMATVYDVHPSSVRDFELLGNSGKSGGASPIPGNAEGLVWQNN